MSRVLWYIMLSFFVVHLGVVQSRKLVRVIGRVEAGKKKAPLQQAMAPAPFIPGPDTEALTFNHETPNFLKLQPKE